MKLKRLPLICVIAAAPLIWCEAPAACTLQDLDISRAVNARVSVFTDAGKFERSAPLNEVLPGKVVACHPTLGLIQIARADGSRMWIDPIDVKLPASSARPTTVSAKAP